MVKPSTLSAALRFSAFLVLLSCPGCSGAKSRAVDAAATPTSGPAEHPMTSAVSSSPARVQKLWSHPVPGLMTDLAVSRDGSAVILATIPNPDAVAGPRETGHGLTRFDRTGKQLWHIDIEGTVKSLALSDDGKLALVSTYDNKLSAIDVRGKTVWAVDGMCKPIAVGKRFLCYHDDDAEPGVAFDVYSDRGRKVLFYPIARDVLALKVSDDGHSTAIALEGGQLTLFGPDFRTVWQRKVSGEVLDLAVSSGEHPRVWALFNSRDARKDALPGQNIAVFDEDGKQLGETQPASRVEQIEAAFGGAGLAAYGNSPQGQFVAFYEFSAKARPAFAEKWYRNNPHEADFSSSLIMARDSVIFGYEDVSGSTRRSRLMAFDFDGGLKWDLPLVTEDGAYLYAHGFAPIPSVIAVGTDDGYLRAFRIQAP